MLHGLQAFRVRSRSLRPKQTDGGERTVTPQQVTAHEALPPRKIRNRAIAGGGTRTLKPLRVPDFESGASASSATPAAKKNCKTSVATAAGRGSLRLSNVARR